ncbi:MFS transporter [Salinisphaera sp. SWV1]|uniref:MFS transporter n=1 Tax=Salinisphaera sp. SWV1 TaxID=3454139 RepID=UPI003F866FE9
MQNKKLNWYSDLNKTERATFKTAFGGWTLDAFDFMVMTFLITTLMSVMNITQGEAGLLSTVTLMTSAIGGWGAGILADRYGRVRVLQYTIAAYSLCTFLIGFTQNYDQFITLRALQGLGFGGEWAVGGVLLGEIIRPEHRGKALGTIQSGWAVGWGLAALSYVAIFAFAPQDIAWRVMFWMGVLPALLVIYIRRYVPEPEIFNRTRKNRDAPASPWTIFKPELIRTTFFTALVSTGLQGGYYGINTWLPTFLQREHDLSVFNTGGYLFVIIFGSFVGYVSGGYLSDRIGRRGNLLFFSALACAVIYIYTQLPINDAGMLFLGLPLGIASAGGFGSVGAFFTELFPSEVRANGQAFSYNFGRAIGAIFPAFVGFIADRAGLGIAIGVFAGTAYALVFVAALCLPETRGLDLNARAD